MRDPSQMITDDQYQADLRISRFVWISDEHTDLMDVAQSDGHRFSQEHGYRFDKQSLFWTDVRVRTPAQFEELTGGRRP